MRSFSVKGPIGKSGRIAMLVVSTATALTVLASFGTGAGGHPSVRRAPRLSTFAPKLPKARNFLLVLTESVRFDSVCVEYRADCKLTPFTNRLAEARFPLLGMRSNSSTTAISVGVVWSGLLPTQMTDAIRSAPMIFDFARAGGYDTAYWSSQAAMFTGSSAFFGALPLSQRCSGADLGEVLDDAGADDTLVTERVKRELPKLREPWFAVVQYANTHYPYRVRGEEPFQPATEDKSPEETERFKNHYQNSVYAQDKTVADLLSAVRASAAGARTVVMYTSDHGEAFREHGQLGHTTSVFEEELHVPTWIDAPPDVLTTQEREALAAVRETLVWHVDIAPTILDGLGLWDAPAVVTARQRMVGTTLFRSKRTTSILPLTNCTEIWGCSFRNWGVARGNLKLESREFDADWHCWDLARDPYEQHDLGEKACGDMKSAAETFFGRLPRQGAEMRGVGP
jgi:membrane-anchored protein YejM (alkaline phosphatase superfamily)